MASLRTARSALSALPGPSRLALSAVPRPPARSLFNFANVRLPLPFRRTPAEADAASSPTKNTAEPAKPETTDSEGSTASVFDGVAEAAAVRRRAKATEHAYKSAAHKISHRKLNQLSRQIAALPVGEAIVQMQFSEKRASSWILPTLALARDHATDKGLDAARLVVAETWVSKGRKEGRVDIKGRGRIGIKHHPTARLHVVLREGKTWEERRETERRRELALVRSAGVVREDGKLRRKVISGWNW
ncbi:hypothetical protein Q5752_001084 [Cryptotrichosporon argae]